ncbi:putative F-box protein-like [Capsicum annuum]|nr:putative F-box protein-like [Capsicum annuum]
MDESEVSPNDVVGKVLGKEYSGRVRCLGLGVVPSRFFKQTRSHFISMSSSSSNSSCPSNCQGNYTQMLDGHKNSQENYKELVNSHNLMMNAFKAYMIMKEGMMPEQFVGFFTPTSTDVSSGPLSDANGRSSGDSYSSDNH